MRLCTAAIQVVRREGRTRRLVLLLVASIGRRGLCWRLVSMVVEISIALYGILSSKEKSSKKRAKVWFLFSVFDVAATSFREMLD